MGVLERPTRQKIIMTSTLYGLCAGAVLLFSLLLAAAGHLGNVTTAQTSIAAIGPLHLAEISKTPALGGGFTAAIRLLPGVSLYAAFWVGLSATLGVLRTRTQPRS